MKLFILLFSTIMLLCSCRFSPNDSDNLSDMSPIATESPDPMPTLSASPTPDPDISSSAEPTPIEPSEEAAPERIRISRASTPLLDKSGSRIRNISRAAAKINAFILAPGEVFSFNGSVGERSADKGYEKAAAIIDGEKQDDYGGGVCQLATTIYQAAESAGLKIIERHNHQKDVGYTAPGTDAAVNYGTLDMKFQNTADSSVMIAVLVGENNVIAEIYKMNY